MYLGGPNYYSTNITDSLVIGRSQLTLVLDLPTDPYVENATPTSINCTVETYSSGMSDINVSLYDMSTAQLINISTNASVTSYQYYSAGVHNITCNSTQGVNYDPETVSDRLFVNYNEVTLIIPGNSVYYVGEDWTISCTSKYNVPVNLYINNSLVNQSNSEVTYSTSNLSASNYTVLCNSSTDTGYLTDTDSENISIIKWTPDFGDEGSGALILWKPYPNWTVDYIQSNTTNVTCYSNDTSIPLTLYFNGSFVESKNGSVSYIAPGLLPVYNYTLICE